MTNTAIIIKRIHRISVFTLIFSMLASSAMPYQRALAASPSSRITGYAAVRAGRLWMAPDQPVITLSKSDAVAVDQNHNGKADAGDTLRYTLVLQNNGTEEAQNVTVEDRLDANLTLAAGSLETTPLAYNQQVAVIENLAQPITLQASDVDGDALSYTIVTPPAHGLLSGSAPALTYTPAAGYSGGDSFDFKACDTAAPTPNCDQAAVAITIAPINHPPAFTIGSDVTVLEDAGAQTVLNWASGISAGSLSEDLTQALTFQVSSDSSSLFATGPAVDPSGTLSFTPAAHQNGAATISVYLQDDGGIANGGVDSSPVQTFTITVTAVNDAPTFIPGEDVSVLENSAAYSAAWASAVSAGPNETGQTVHFEIVGNTNQPLFSNGPAVAADGELSFTPAPDQNGVATVSILLKDDGDTANGGSNVSATVDFQIHVIAINHAPTFTKGSDVIVLEDAGAQTIAGWATAISAGGADSGQVLSFEITQNTNTGLFSAGPAITAGGALSFTPALDQNGSATLTVVLHDDGGTAYGGIDASPAQSFTISVTAVNDAPGFTSGGDVTVLEGSGAFDQSWATSITPGPADEMGQTVLFEITHNTNPALFSAAPAMSSAGWLSFRPVPGVNGSAVITVRLTDNGGTANGGSDASATQTFTINVTAVNDAPSFTSGGDVTVNEDSGAYAAAWATNISAGPGESGQTLTFVVTQNTNAGLFLVAPAVAADGTLSFTPAANQNGTAAITVELRDNGGTANGGVNTSPAQIFSITVNAVNDAPAFTRGSDLTLLEDAGPQTISAWATLITPGAANESGQQLTFQVSVDKAYLFSSAPSVNPGNGALTFTPEANQFGVATVTVWLEDDGGTANGGIDASATQTFTITITGVNDVPGFTSGGDVTVLEDAGNISQAWATAVTAGPYETGQTVHFDITDVATPTLFSAGPAIDSAGKLSFTPAHDLNGSSTVTVRMIDNGGTVNGGIDTSAVQTFTIFVTAVDDSPLVTGENYDTAGNTLLEIGPSSSAAGAHAFFQGNLLSNDTDPENVGPLTATLASASPGAVVTIQADGTFTYLPPAGRTAIDTFTYTVKDATGQTAPGTVTIHFFNRVWYVQRNAAAGGTGRSADPFTTLAAVEAVNIGAVNDTIFVYYGNGSSDPNGITLKNGQRLIGEAVALTIPEGLNGQPGPTTLYSAGLQPKIDAGSGNGVSASDLSAAEIRGLDIGGSTNAIDVTYTNTSYGSITIQDNTLHSGGSEGIDMNLNGSGTLTLQIDRNTISGSSGLDIRRTGGAGTICLEASNNQVTAASSGGAAIWIDGASAATLTITAFANNTISGDTTGIGVNIQNATLDSTPGGSFQKVSAGDLAIGSSGNPVGAAGLVLTSVAGDLGFTNLNLYAGNGAALKLSGTTAYTGSAGVQLTANTNSGTISATNGPALEITTARIDLQNVRLISTNSPTYGIYLNTVTGTLQDGTSGSSINNPTDLAFWGTNSAATVTFNGPITSTKKGISLTMNTGSTFTFNGVMTLSTGLNDAFKATGGGTVVASAATNSLITTTGIPLTVLNTTIGVGGLKFRSISANGAAKGIDLESTGNSGSLTVSGTSAAGSGGTINATSGDAVILKNTMQPSLSWLNVTNGQAIGINMNTVTGPTLSSIQITNGQGIGINMNTVTGPTLSSIQITNGQGIGINMNTVTGPTLSSIQITNGQGIGINMNTVTGMTLSNIQITNTGNGDNEYNVNANNLTGNAVINNVTFDGFPDTGIYLSNSANIADLNLVVQDSTFHPNVNSVYGEDGIQIETKYGQHVNALVDHNTFNNLWGDGVNAVVEGTNDANGGQLDLTVTNNTFSYSTHAGGVNVAASDKAKAYLQIDSNTFTDNEGYAINLAKGNAASLDATITNNTINAAGITSSLYSAGIRLSQVENGAMAVKVENNTITGTAFEGLRATAGIMGDTGTGSLDLTVKGNTFNQPRTLDMDGTLVAVRGANTACLDMTDNTSSGNAFGYGIYVFTAIANNLKIFGLTGGAAAYLSTHNNNAEVYATAGIPAAPIACKDPVPPTQLARYVGSVPPIQPVAAEGRGKALAVLVPQSGETIHLDIGRLPAGKQMTISFDVVIAAPLPQNVLAISNQASVSGDNFTRVLSDDPDTQDPADPTLTILNVTPVANPDEYSLNEDEPLSVLAAQSVLSNDLHSLGVTLTAILDSPPAWGTLILNSDGSFTYTPAENDHGDVTFRYRASDGEQVSAPTTVTLHLQAINDAPLLDNSLKMALSPIRVNQTDNPGTAISALLASAGADPVVDVDSNPQEGIAVIAADAAHGSWQFSINAGGSWSDLGTTAETAARLLAADAGTRIRFIPAAGWSGTLDPAITFRAWDQTSGTNGGTGDATKSGGTSAFSLASATATLLVEKQIDLGLTQSATSGAQGLTPGEAVLAGNGIVYQIDVTNQGPSQATQIVLTDTLPAGVDYQWDSGGCSLAGSVLTCPISDLAAGEKITVNVWGALQTTAKGAFTNHAAVAAAENDAAPVDNASNLSLNAVSSLTIYTLPETPGSEWSDPGMTLPPCGNDSFLGELGNESEKLHLENLPEHSLVTLAFDLYIIRSWDGNQSVWPMNIAPRGTINSPNGAVGPDRWMLKTTPETPQTQAGAVGIDRTLVDTTFANWATLGFHQAYPDAYPGGDHPAETGAYKVNSMCYQYAGITLDSTYHMVITFEHSGNVLDLDFSAMGLQSIQDESWGLDDVQVSLSSGADLMPKRIYLPLVGR